MTDNRLLSSARVVDDVDASLNALVPLALRKAAK